MTRREERIRRLRREADHRSGGEKPMVYTPEMRTQVRAKAVEGYKQNLTEWVERGAVLTETDGGRGWRGMMLERRAGRVADTSRGNSMRRRVRVPRRAGGKTASLSGG